MDVQIDPESPQVQGEYGLGQKPTFFLGQHDSERELPLTDIQYRNLISAGATAVTTPVTNKHFRSRVFDLVVRHLESLQRFDTSATTTATAAVAADPVVSPITTKDTGLFPGHLVSNFTAYTSPWIDLCSPNPVVSNVSRQVLNLEVSYANFSGIRYIVIPGPRHNESTGGGNQALTQYARAVLEALQIAPRINFTIHMPMYWEPGLGEEGVRLSALPLDFGEPPRDGVGEVELFGAWDTWNRIRSFCNYNSRLCVALRIPKMMPEIDLQERWFAEPVYFYSLSPDIFQTNKSGYPCLSKHHQNMLSTHMKLKIAPWLLLCDMGPDMSSLGRTSAELGGNVPTDADFPPLGASEGKPKADQAHSFSSYVAYLKWLEFQQEPRSALESTTLFDFQDWLQSPLQPLSDNLESATYEVFEGDPVKYNQYEQALVEALSEWHLLGKPTSSKSGAVVIAVVGAGRGPLVTRALRASETTGVPVEVWAVEKNPNAYVYLLRQNEVVWGGHVRVVKTDMRAWEGPTSSSEPAEAGDRGKVDILVSELLGSFGDNELSPECLDGIQHVLADNHGISIPSSYTAHFTPIAAPKIYGDLLGRLSADGTALDTPWVVRLYAIDYVAQRGVPGHPRFQQAWEFSHPIPAPVLEMSKARGSGGVVGGGGGSMSGGRGVNDHNSRFCHLTFVCRNKGFIHGLAGYFESTLYQSQVGDRAKVEISTHPQRIDQKSRDMISWFPIFFPLRHPLNFPEDTELEVSMWRQTDDTRVWYEWLVEAYTWIKRTERIKVGSSGLCSSRKVACLM